MEEVPAFHMKTPQSAEEAWSAIYACIDYCIKAQKYRLKPLRSPSDASAQNSIIPPDQSECYVSEKADTGKVAAHLHFPVTYVDAHYASSAADSFVTTYSDFRDWELDVSIPILSDVSKAMLDCIEACLPLMCPLMWQSVLSHQPISNSSLHIKNLFTSGCLMMRR